MYQFYGKINRGQVSRLLYRGCSLSEGPLLEVLLYMIITYQYGLSHVRFFSWNTIPATISSCAQVIVDKRASEIGTQGDHQNICLYHISRFLQRHLLLKTWLKVSDCMKKHKFSFNKKLNQQTSHEIDTVQWEIFVGQISVNQKFCESSDPLNMPKQHCILS